MPPVIHGLASYCTGIPLSPERAQLSVHMMFSKGNRLMNKQYRIQGYVITDDRYI